MNTGIVLLKLQLIKLNARVNTLQLINMQFLFKMGYPFTLFAPNNTDTVVYQCIADCQFYFHKRHLLMTMSKNNLQTTDQQCKNTKSKCSRYY